PHPEAPGPEDSGAQGEALPCPKDGRPEAEDPRGLRGLPQEDSSGPALADPSLAMTEVTGEPDAWKLARPVWRGADGKGPSRSAPRQRPTLREGRGAGRVVHADNDRGQRRCRPGA